MSDKAHNETDKILAELEAHLAGIYDEAGTEVEAKADEYFKRFEAADNKKAAAVKAGKLSEDEYLRWRKNKLLYGEHWKRLISVIASEYAAVNSTALAYINGKLPAIYALNYNHIGKDIAKQAEGIGGYSFELVNADVIKNLATKDKTLLPYKYLDGKKDVRWNTKKVNSAVLQGILQGESIPKMAKRLQSVTEMNKVSAIRNARTSVTSAECKARQDGFERAAKNGIEQEREWIATNDYRTRHVHRLLDGQTVGVDEPFRSELGNIMYPGDPSAHPSNVYNCRCTVISHVKSLKGVQVEAGDDYADRLTAQDLYEKDPKEFDIRQKMLYNKNADKEQLARYKKRLRGEAPQSISEFQSLKYREPEKYSELKEYYRYRGIAPDSDMRFFYANKAKDVLYRQGEIKAKGIVVKQSPVSIIGKRDHAVDQMAARNIDDQSAQRFVNNSIFALRQQNGKVFAYYSQEGFATVDIDGILRTVGQLDRGGKLLFKEVTKFVGDKK